MRAMAGAAIDISIEHDFDSQRQAAAIWARATARRDNHARPAETATKLPGIQRRLAEAGATLHIARRETTAEGFALFVPRPDALELVYLAVDADCWGSGTGSALLAHATEYARVSGYTELELWVITDNVRALRVYERSGWRATADVKDSDGRLERRMVRSAG